jgi:transposase
MSDALWARVAAVLAGMNPAPPPNSRALLDALIYLTLSGSTWDDLPAAYPPAAEVAAAAARWQAAGLVPRLESVLLFRLVK